MIVKSAHFSFMFIELNFDDTILNVMLEKENKEKLECLTLFKQ